VISKEDIENIASEILKEYGQFPQRLIEDARSERNIAESEQGRYILELLQNADDAQTPETISDMVKIGEPRVLFLLTEKYLYCANGGYQISKEGLNSICRAFLSPKRKDTPVIGFKGIGFKSVLALTEQPEIFWSGGGVRFSRELTFQYLKTEAPIAVANQTPEDVPVLRCPHLINVDSELEADPTLRKLLADSATVFRFQLADETTRQNLITRLTEVKASTVLFLNNLRTVEIITSNESKTYQISKSNVEKNIERGVIYDITEAKIQDGEKKSNWTIVSGTYELPSLIKKQLSPAWKDTDCVKISYATGMDEDGKPFPCPEYPYLHVFFPTEERTPFRILTHGTFKTNVDRRLLTQEDPLNEYMIKKLAELIRDKVLPAISERIDEPGRILDFLQPPQDLSTTSMEGRIWSELFNVLTGHSFVPDRFNKGKLSPNHILLTPLTRGTERFKSAIRGELAKRFCYGTIDVNRERRETLKKLGASIFEIIGIPKFFEENFATETTWVANVYAILDEVSSYLDSVDQALKSDFIQEVRNRRLLLLSNGEAVNAGSTEKDEAIFLPPVGDIPTPPEGLSLRFLNRPAIDEYLKISSKTMRQTFLYQELKIEEYASIPVITKAILPAIRDFWQQWPSKKVFEPGQVLGFLHALLGESPPEDDRIKAITLMPVPIKGEKQYAQAFGVYASLEWTGNDDLEFIYGSHPASCFLAPPSTTVTSDNMEGWKKFYQWLGISWVPRVLPQFEEFEDNRWNYCSWTYNKCPTSPHSKLPNWADYCTELFKQCKKMGDHNPLDKHSVCQYTSWAIDRFNEIVSNPDKSKRLLSVLVTKWETHYSQYMKCQIAWRDKYKKDYFLTEVSSYFAWQVKSHPWIASSRFDLWGLKKPSDLFIKTDSLYNELGDLIPYVDYRTEPEKILLAMLGVRTSVDDLTAEDWWRIATDMPRLLKPEERVVRPLYRRMMQVENIEQENAARDGFMLNGKLLALAESKWDFTDRDEVWYIESEEFRRLFGNYVPIFAIQHEERRGAAVKRTYEINVLEEHLRPKLDIGDEDEPASDLLNQFLDSIKPFLAARVYAQRPSREAEDVSYLRRLKLCAVKSLKVAYALDIEGRPIEETSDKGTYLDKQNSLVYVDARSFHIKDLQTIEQDQKLASELGVQIAYYLGIDLANDFMLLMKSSAELRYEILSRANVSVVDVNHFMESLKEIAGKPPQIVGKIPPAQQISPTLQPPASTGAMPANTGPPQIQVIPLELWNPSELGFEEPVETIPHSDTKSLGTGSSGPGTYTHPGYLTDPDERERVNRAGVALVVAYEKHRHGKEHDCTAKVESREKANCGYDILSQCDKETRQIEVKSSRGDLQVVELTASEWEAARETPSGDDYYLYRVRNLDKRSGREPEIVIIRNPYSVLMGEPTRFKVRLNRLRGKMEIVPLTKSSAEQR
jgi:hypothetical protein